MPTGGNLDWHRTKQAVLYWAKKKCFLTGHQRPLLTSSLVASEAFKKRDSFHTYTLVYVPSLNLPE